MASDNLDAHRYGTNEVRGDGQARQPHGRQCSQNELGLPYALETCLALQVKPVRKDVYKRQLDNCRVYAPFKARVTNLKISEGAYTKVGQQIFVLIDVRRWWAIANFREGQLPHITRGTRADVYVVSEPNRHFSGFVESISFGVTPDPDLIGSFENGLPDVQRTLNWVHLASRYPVWIRVENPDADLFRVSESAVVIIRGH